MTRHIKGYLRASLAAVLPLAAVVLYMGWNYERTGKVHFSSTQSFNAIYYYYFYFSDKEGVDAAQAFLQAERDKIAALPSFSARYDYANKRGIELLKENFGSYMLYHLKHSARLLVDPGKGEWDMFTGKLTLGRLYQNQSTGFYATLKAKGINGISGYIRNNPSFVLAMMILFFNFVRLAGLAIFIFSRNVHIYVRLFVVMLIGYFAITTGPIANTRYFIPVSLIAIGCATLGYQRLLQHRDNKTNITSPVSW